MRLATSDAKTYPKLATFIRNVLPNVKLEKKTIEAIKHHSGADEKTINVGLTWNNGPEVQVKMLVPHQVGGKTQTPTGGYQWGFNVIEVATADVGRFQTNQDMRHTRVGDLHLLKIILLHELTHWAREKSKTQEDPNVEDGWAFEEELYGKEIER